MPTVLALLAEGFEEIEFVAPVDLLRRAGVTVTTASIGESIHVTGRSGITLHTDTLLSVVDAAAFDLLFLPGGPGVKNLRADPRVAKLAKNQMAAGKWIGAICAAPTVLNDAGLLAGRRYTAHFSTANELSEIIANERVVVDGKLITSRGAGTAIEFGLALVGALISKAKADEVARSVCFE
ncbi:MAG TPA: DJ-1 family glyoxalase III [Opitutaceae bacterium]|nr:DJ-1 family glyoxalase III [Opitutaceae bacterium]